MDSFPFKYQVLALAVIFGGLVLLIGNVPPVPTTTEIATSTQVSASASAPIESAATSTPATSSTTETSSAPSRPVSAVGQPNASSPTVPNQVHRIENPYTTPPLAFETVNGIARSALVNIFCFSPGGLMAPVSGSGIIIDSRGVVLTNAHVAQYVLLAGSGRVHLQCHIRAGSPASPKWMPHILYIPPVWVEEHAADITKTRPFGTGKHDYALLYVGATLDGSVRPAVFPAVAVDTREAIGFVGDAVLAASYPAEFLGAISTNFNLYHVTSLAEIEELLTLGGNSVDVIAIGSVIGAQSGSSGGAILNAWARLVGVITTTSEGSTTGERTLRGITLSYIDRDLMAQTGSSLSAFLSGDLALKAAEFSRTTAPALIEKLLAELN